MRESLLATGLAASALVSACGYRVVGSEPPFGVTRIAVVAFDEDTPAGLSPDLTGALSTRLAAEGMTVVSDAASADAVLTGRVVSTRTTAGKTVATSDARVPSYRISVRVSAKLTDRGGDQLWSTTVNVGEDFLASSNPGSEAGVQTEANRRRALRRIAEQAARDLHERLVVDATLAPDETNDEAPDTEPEETADATP